MGYAEGSEGSRFAFTFHALLMGVSVPACAEPNVTTDAGAPDAQADAAPPTPERPTPGLLIAPIAARAMVGLRHEA